MRPDDKMIKELMSEIEAYTNGIGAVLFPIGNKDLPTAVYAMRTTLKALESEMTEDQKESCLRWSAFSVLKKR